MSEGINLIIIKGTQGYDITELVKSVNWSGRKGAAARYIEVDLLDDEERLMRADISIEKGVHCVFSYDGIELFRGIIMRTQQSSRVKLVFKAYDNGIYLANNKDTFSYSDKTLSEIFKDICSRFGMMYSECAASEYRIPELTKPKTTAYDALCDAMSQVYYATGERYYIDSQNGYLRLLKRSENILLWVIETGSNLISYTDTSSIEKVKTRIRLLSDEGTVLAETSNRVLENAIGVMQDIDSRSETLNNAQLQEIVSSMLSGSSMAEHALKVDALGITDVVSGSGVFIIIPALNISRTYYVDADSHNFKDRYHKMSLTLNLMNSSEYSNAKITSEKKSSAKTDKTDQVVNFLGGSQYLSQNSTSPIVGIRTAGRAKIKDYVEGARHPYYLVGGKYNELGGECNVYGWVDSSRIG